MFKQFLKDEKGQTSVEYLMIIAVMVVAITMFGSKLQQLLPAALENVFKNINAKINTLMNG